MRDLPEVIELGPKEEAERLWNGATEAFARAGDSLVALCEAVDLGIRAAEIIAFERLHPGRSRFPATIAAQLEVPAPEVDVHRDAVVVPKTLGFTEQLDLLSDEHLPCVAPQLHRGWEDRRFACARSRVTTRETIGVVLDANARDPLLLLSAYRNRLFRFPPPIRIPTREVLAAFPSLIKLVADLKISPAVPATS